MSEDTAAETPRLPAMLRSPLGWATALVIALGAWLYLPLFFPPSHRSLVQQSEGFFFQANEAAGGPVLVLALWLFYRRSHLREVLRGPGAPALALPAWLFSAALYVWGGYTSAPDLQLASLIGLLAGTALWLGGFAALRAYGLPIAFLAFALPVSPVLIASTIFPIQLATAQYAGFLLSAVGLEAVVQGDQILRPETTFVVIETCSGVRTMITLSMLTILMIDLFERRGGHAILLFALAPAVAFVVNGLRVVTLVLNPHSSVHSIHNLQGIGMLLVGLIGMYLLDGLLERMLGGRTSAGGSAEGEAIREEASSVRMRVAGLVLVAALLFAMSISDRVVTPWRGRAGLAETPAALLARVFGEEAGSTLPPDYDFLGSASYLAQARRIVEIDGGPVEVFLGVANEQKREVSILTGRLAWPASGYSVVREATESMGASGPMARRVVLERGDRSMLSYSWVERRGSLLGEWLRQALALDRSPLARPAHMLAIRISAPLGAEPGESDLREAERRIRWLWNRLSPELRGYAPTERPSDS